MIRMLIAAALAALTFAAQAAVDVNQATQAQLESVRGVGPAMSQRILDERRAGPFKDWTDLITRVRGVGEGSAARLSAAGLTVGGNAFTAMPRAAAAAGTAAPAAEPAAASRR
jgi:competence protein ComEA